MAQERILITGSAGFLGSRLTKELLASTNACLFLLRRAGGRNPLVAGDNQRGRRITIIEADITEEGLGLERNIFKELSNKVDTIFHCAAAVDISKAGKDIFDVNVKGTENILNFAISCQKNKRLKKINHISTAYVVGDRGISNIIFYEDQLNIGQGFNNLYEQTKFEAELLAHKFIKRGLPVDIYRPSIMVESLPVRDYNGHSLFFKPFKFLITGMFKQFPADMNARYNFISVDDTARAIVKITAKAKTKSKTYHLVNPVYIKLHDIVSAAKDVFGVKHMPRFIPMKNFDMNSVTDVQKKMLRPFIPYFNFKARFDSSNTEEALRDIKFNYLSKEDIGLLFRYIKKNKV